MNYFKESLTGVFLFVLILASSCKEHTVVTNNIVSSCSLYYYKDILPWDCLWFADGTAKDMLEEFCIVVEDSTVINSLKHHIDSIYDRCSIELPYISTLRGPIIDEVDTRFLAIFHYSSKSDTLALGPTSDCKMSINGRYFISSDIYYGVINLIKSKDLEWSELVDQYYNGGVFHSRYE